MFAVVSSDGPPIVLVDISCTVLHVELLFFVEAIGFRLKKISLGFFDVHIDVDLLVTSLGRLGRLLVSPHMDG